MDLSKERVCSSVTRSSKASAELDDWTRRTMESLHVLRSRRIGDQSRLRSVLRTGETIKRLLEQARRSDAVMAMDQIDLAECLALHWVEEIHRIFDDATVVGTG